MENIILEAVEILMKYQQRTLFQIPYLKILPKDTVYLSGQNGAGKTTLLKILAGLQKPTQGRLNLNPPSFLARLAGFKGQSGVLYMHQNPYLFDATVAQNVAYGLRRKHYSRKISRQITLQALQMMNIEPLSHKHISILSGGERQKVAMARAFALNPALLLMDESNANLDGAAIDAQTTMINALLEKGGSVVITSHHPNALTKRCNRHWNIENQGIIEKYIPLMIDKDDHVCSS